MKTLQITEKGKIEVANTTKPELKQGEVLLKIKYVGFCGSDLNTFRGMNAMAKMPVVPGHEIGATIEAVGDKVPDFLKVGQNATINPYTACGHCSACLHGQPNACEHNQTLGVQRDGAMSEYFVCQWEKVIPDNEISARDFALVEPMSVGFHAVNRAKVTDSDTVMVFGCGMIGVGAIVRASLRGATVIAVDVDDKKLSLAKRLGAKFTVNSATENLHQSLMEFTNGFGPDVVIEAVGRPQTYQAAIEEVAFAGRVVCIGYAKENILLNTSLFVKKEMTIRGSRNAMPEDFKAVMNYIKRGECPINELISGIVKPEESQSALENWNNNPGNVFRILVNFE